MQASPGQASLCHFFAPRKLSGRARYIRACVDEFILQTITELDKTIAAPLPSISNEDVEGIQILDGYKSGQLFPTPLKVSNRLAFARIS